MVGDPSMGPDFLQSPQSVTFVVPILRLALDPLSLNYYFHFELLEPSTDEIDAQMKEQ